ncbi:hypothetical protein IAQ00_09835 [Pantoea ananatis]|uniref:hypothetical protein n=1 Tax=Pantoea ananas TaxID=553 RepID=UPI00207A4996|nr:hypothetical protein [Pantoea ananatis]MCW0353992.1 hypothetical protein [Pantoea ananatis]USL60004.1 hypothetical protein IAQ00_09835 [Pantoea ananatis]
MTVTTIPTEFALKESMRSLAISTILVLCEQHKINSADLEKLTHQLARSEANLTTPQSTVL